MKKYGYIIIAAISLFFWGCGIFGSSEKKMITVRVVPKEVKVKKDSGALECHNVKYFSWAVNTGGSLSEAGSGICTDKNGNSYVTGSFQGVVLFDKDNKFSSRGQDDMFLAGFTRDGKPEWVKHIGDSSIEAGSATCIDSSGNICFTGYYAGWDTFSKDEERTSGNSNIFIKKFDNLGKMLWTKHAYGVGTKSGSGICADKDGNIYITGYFEGSIVFGGSKSFSSRGKSDMFIAKYDSKGKLLWADRAGGDLFDGGNSVAVDKDGNILVCGFFEEKIKFGNKTIESSGYRDVFLAKYNPKGEVLFVKQAGSPEADDFAYGVAADRSANIYITGMCSGSTVFDDKQLRNTGNFDIFLAKYSADGKVLWARQAGGKLGDAAYGISIAGDESIYLTGYFKDVAKFDTISIGTADKTDDDIFVARYNPKGKIIWVKQAGGSQRDYGFSISNDRVGNSYITGYFSGKCGFDDISLSTATRSIFISKIKEYDSCITKVFEIEETRIDSVTVRDTVIIDD